MSIWLLENNKSHRAGNNLKFLFLISSLRYWLEMKHWGEQGNSHWSFLRLNHCAPHITSPLFFYTSYGYSLP